MVMHTCMGKVAIGIIKIKVYMPSSESMHQRRGPHRSNRSYHIFIFHIVFVWLHIWKVINWRRVSSQCWASQCLWSACCSCLECRGCGWSCSQRDFQNILVLPSESRQSDSLSSRHLEYSQLQGKGLVVPCLYIFTVKQKHLEKLIAIFRAKS